ncbi:unnamed protein product [Heligmosomoides polygyrus]|uniref:RNA-directed RNA polymerase n=1 Tax=Heligmosomoides polygyrus TaxID=6339 RepID=A0A183GEE4_HELPZ|nr:unnamed protein product [Heligmosomoides polygyrus]
MEDVVKVAEDMSEQEDLIPDRYTTVNGWETFTETARTQLSKYKGALRAIMENYGIKTEGAVPSCISEMRNRILDKDQDEI